MTTREGLDLDHEGEDENEETQTDDEEGQSFFSRVNWALIFSLISLIGVVTLWVAMPSDLSLEVGQLQDRALVQGDSIKALADTVAVHENRLDRHWNRMGDIENTMAVAAKVDSAFDAVHTDIETVRKTTVGEIAGLRKQVKASSQRVESTEAEIALLREAIADDKANVRASKKGDGDWWDFARGKGGQ